MRVGIEKDFVGAPKVEKSLKNLLNFFLQITFEDILGSLQPDSFCEQARFSIN